MTWLRRWLGDIVSFAVIAGLFGAVYLLPPDTSLSQIQEAGIMRVCVPPSYPPLVTRDPQMPGFEIELLEAVAERMGVRLVPSTNPAIGSNFNPRSWRVTRANCQVIAGGVIATEMTRSFLDTTPPHLETGWALITPQAPPQDLTGLTVGFYSGTSGRDRLALSGFLREEEAQVRLVTSSDRFVAEIESGSLDAGVVEALLARQIADENGWVVSWLPLGRDPVAFGLWKGDLTLKREIVAILEDLEAEGVVERLRERYGIAPIERRLGAEASA